MKKEDVSLSFEASSIATRMWVDYSSSGTVSESDLREFHQRMREIKEPRWNIDAWERILFRLEDDLKTEIIAKEHEVIAKGDYTIGGPEGVWKVAKGPVLQESDYLRWNSRFTGFLQKFPGMGRWLARELTSALSTHRSSGKEVGYLNIWEIGRRKMAELPLRSDYVCDLLNGEDVF